MPCEVKVQCHLQKNGARLLSSLKNIIGSHMYTLIVRHLLFDFPFLPPPLCFNVVDTRGYYCSESVKGMEVTEGLLPLASQCVVFNLELLKGWLWACSPS